MINQIYIGNIYTYIYIFTKVKIDSSTSAASNPSMIECILYNNTLPCNMHLQEYIWSTTIFVI